MTIPRKGTPKFEAINILRNVIRIVITGSPFAILIHILTDNITFESPLWLTIAIGAILGGCVFLPAKEIGDSIWAMVTFHIENALGKPDIDDSSDSQEVKEYDDWVQWMRCASPLQIAKKVFIGVAKSIGILMILPSILLIIIIIYISIQDSVTLENMIQIAVASVISLAFLYIVFVVVVDLILALGAKLYYNEYYPMEKS